MDSSFRYKNQLLIDGNTSSVKPSITTHSNQYLNRSPLIEKQILTIQAKLPSKTGLVSFQILIDSVSSSNSIVITSGWHVWSGHESRGKNVGIGEIKAKTSKTKTTFVVEPGEESKKISNGVGKSYGYVSFRNKYASDNGDVLNYFIGIIPSLRETEDISFEEVEGKMRVTITKDLENVELERDVKYQIFLGTGSFDELNKQYSLLLSDKVKKVRPSSHRKIWFSWAAYGKGVTQENIEQELEQLCKLKVNNKIAVDTIIIDDGWEYLIGDWRFREDKFPDPRRLVKKITNKGMKPGIWIAPFMILAETKLFTDNPSWIVPKNDGGELFVSNPQIQPTGNLFPLAERAHGLDISMPEVRNHIHSQFLNLFDIGFRSFKVDFVSTPFMGKLRNKDKTSTEYYRLFFEDLRKLIRRERNSEIEIIGCGAPIAESIDLFELCRISPDSALPYLENLPVYGHTLSWIMNKSIAGNLFKTILKKIDTHMYLDAAMVSFRRATTYKLSHGQIMDGIHISDPSILIDTKVKDDIAEILPYFSKLTLISNLFIGDSIIRSGEGGVKEWNEFLSKFYNME